MCIYCKKKGPMQQPSYRYFCNEPPQEYVILLWPSYLLKWGGAPTILQGNHTIGQKWNTLNLTLSADIASCMHTQPASKTKDHVSASASGLFMCWYDLSCLVLNSSVTKISLDALQGDTALCTGPSLTTHPAFWRTLLLTWTGCEQV